MTFERKKVIATIVPVKSLLDGFLFQERGNRLKRPLKRWQIEPALAGKKWSLERFFCEIGPFFRNFPLQG